MNKGGAGGHGDIKGLPAQDKEVAVSGLLSVSRRFFLIFYFLETFKPPSKCDKLEKYLCCHLFLIQ